MSLFTVAVTGAVISLLVISAGLAWLGLGHRLAVPRLDRDDAVQLAAEGAAGRPAASWFRGLGKGLSFSGEKSTRQIITLLRLGRWGEGLPWAIAALGTLAALFFWPLVIGLLLDLGPVPLWGLVAFCTLSGLYAAWPRARR